MATTTRTIFDNCRDIVDKVGATNSISENALSEMAFKYITRTSQVYTFEQLATGLYRYASQKHLYLYAPTFTGEGGVDYTIHANASILVTAGTHSTQTIAVTGTPIRFYAFVSEVCMYLASQLAQKGTVSTGSSSVAMVSVRDELQRMAAYYAQMDEMYGL